jgi:hypothetical protein
MPWIHPATEFSGNTKTVESDAPLMMPLTILSKEGETVHMCAFDVAGAEFVSSPSESVWELIS